MNVIEIAVFALVSLVVLVLIKKNNPQISVVAEFAVIVVVMMGVIPEFKELAEVCKNIGSVTSVSSDVLKTMIKAFSIVTVGGITADVCRDNGENALAGVVDTVVKILAISCAVPTFTAVLMTALTILEQ